MKHTRNIFRRKKIAAGFHSNQKSAQAHHASLSIVSKTNVQHDDNNSRYAPMAEMNFGPPQMSMTSGPRLTYGAIISSTQLFTQAQWHCLFSPPASSSLLQRSGGGGGTAGSSSSSAAARSDEQRIDSARREWERATPENLRRMQPTDLHKILQTSSSSSSSSSAAAAAAAGTSSTNAGGGAAPSTVPKQQQQLDLSTFLTGHELTVPLLSAPRLIKRPFDPLICENMILSRATALVPRAAAAHRSRATSPSATRADKPRSPSRDGTSGGASGNGSDPWFDSMDENNTRLALEVNLVLILCQALEGVRSPRLAVRDRQLIVRETATELGVFFDFLEHRGQRQADWQVAASLVDPFDANRSRLVRAAEELDRWLPARLAEGSTVQKRPLPARTILEEDSMDMGSVVEQEARSREDVVSSGGFRVHVDTAKLLPLLGKLLKSVVESLDSAQFG